MKAANAYDLVREMAHTLPPPAAAKLLDALDRAMRCTMIDPLDVFCDAIDRMQSLSDADRVTAVDQLHADIHSAPCYPGDR